LPRQKEQREKKGNKYLKSFLRIAGYGFIKTKDKRKKIKEVELCVENMELRKLRLRRIPSPCPVAQKGATITLVTTIGYCHSSHRDAFGRADPPLEGRNLL
jgi:hypothetical protein